MHETTDNEASNKFWDLETKPKIYMAKNSGKTLESNSLKSFYTSGISKVHSPRSSSIYVESCLAEQLNHYYSEM